MNKKCKKCKVKKPLTEFYIHKKMTDGHLSFCKQCTRDRIHKHYTNNAEEMRILEKERYQRRKKDPNFSIKKKKYTKKYREKHKITSNMYRKLKLLRPNKCSKCGISVDKIYALHGHHPDYSKPLEVIWVCPLCHAKMHLT